MPPRRSSLVALVVLLAGCGVNGATTDVRVVAPTTTVGDLDEEAPTAAAPVPAAGASSEDPMSDDLATDADVIVPPAIDVTPAFPSVVGVVGDSLTVSAREEIEERFGRVGVGVVLDARESRRMTAGSSELPSGLEAIETVLAQATPDLWVIALGTNDAGVDTERFRDDVGAVLAAISPDAPLVWVDVWIRDRQERVSELNALLRDELSGRAAPTAVVNWYAHGDDDGVITGDGVHLTTLGRQEFADAILAGALTLVGS